MFIKSPELQIMLLVEGMFSGQGMFVLVMAPASKGNPCQQRGKMAIRGYKRIPGESGLRAQNPFVVIKNVPEIWMAKSKRTLQVF